MKYFRIGSSRRAACIALFCFAFCSLGLLLTRAASSYFTAFETRTADAVAGPTIPSRATEEADDVAAFRQSVGGDITPVIIELKGDPGVIRKVAAGQEGQEMSLDALINYARDLVAAQESFRASLGQRGVRALMRETDVPQIDGSVRHVEYRFTYLLNGFVAYVATADLPQLRSLPEVSAVTEEEPVQMHLDRAIDYSLGTQANPADRRTAVYGATQEFTPATGDAAHPEAPRTTKVDGYEGQNINIAVIDSGTDWRHPMFGGIGQTTPLPRVSGQPASASDNKKVIYYYALSSPGDPTDDFGHGTLVASCLAGYSVDGNTPARLGYGTGRDGTGVGPTINSAQLFGTAPQARIMVYKVCGPAPNCLGDIPLSIEDAASPFTLVSSGNTGPTPVAKPVADVINLSLGSTSGDPAATNSRACNNAALAGTIVVASAGNSGPGLGTVGNPGAATLAIGVAASLDPGSVAGSDVLAAGQVADPRVPAAPGPTPEVGATSNQNQAQAGERQGMRIFPVAGGGPLPAESNPAQPVANNNGSLSAHYVFVDRRNATDPVPTSVGNRIALVKFTGAFAGAANSLAAQPVPPSAILLISNTESATAVQVIRGIPTFTITENDGNYLIDRMITGDPGDGDNNVDVPQGTISELPLRLAETISLPAFTGVMAGFSSRGPSDHPNANFRVVKPDVSGPGVGIVGAATVEGIPDDAIGLASTTGYTSANGTSFSGPITAGAMALVRQRVREELNLDSTDALQRLKRFDTVTVARALLQNSATNLRSGLGVPQGDGTNTASINEMGSGHINIADALTANAVMVAPTLLLADANPNSSGNQAEFNPPTNQPPTLEPGGNLKVLLPTASFGVVPVVRLNDTIVRTQEVIIRDVGPNGAGAGTYNLTVQDNRNTNNPAFRIRTTATADDATPVTSVNVPAGGQASFFVRVEADGPELLIEGEEFQWYVTATQSSSSRTLRMPFYFRATTAVFPNSAAPTQGLPQQTEQPATPNCPTDSNGSFIVNWTYTTPTQTGFRVQEATFSRSVFFDDADEPLMPNAVGTTLVTENTKWRDAGIPGTPQTPPQWTSEVNPDTGSVAYFIPNGQGQNHSLSMRNAVTLPPTGVTLTFTTRQSITTNTNFGFVEASTDGVNYFTLLRLTGTFSGTREVDLSGFSGQSVRVRFRYQSATGSASGAQGWWVENININSDNFQTLADTPPADRALTVSGRPYGTYLYRVAALYANPNPLDPNTTIVGPYSNTRCVSVLQSTASALLQSLVSRKAHGSTMQEFDIPLPTSGAPGVEPRSGGASGNHRMIFTFTSPVTAVGGASASGSSSNPSATGAPGPNANQYTVNLSGVPDGQYVAVTLSGVQTQAGNEATVQGTMGALLGDTNEDRSVNSGDAQQTRNRSGQLVDGTNFRSDVNLDGTVNSGDAFIVRRQSGNAISQ